MTLDQVMTSLAEQVDEIIADKVADAVDQMRRDGATPEDIEKMLEWHVPEMAAARQSAVAEFRAVLSRDWAALH
jgi:hypothetical protein